eukprot:4047132-Prymnesium_polylepis.1
MAEYAPKVTCVAKVHELVSASLLWSAWTGSQMDTKEWMCSHGDPDSTGCMRHTCWQQRRSQRSSE